MSIQHVTNYRLPEPHTQEVLEKMYDLLLSHDAKDLAEYLFNEEDLERIERRRLSLCRYEAVQ